MKSKERDWEWLTLMVAVNDDHGNPQGMIDKLEIGPANDFEQMISLEGPIPGPVFRDMRVLLLPQGTRIKFKISRRVFCAYGYQSWVGNWCWDAYLIGPKTAAKIVNHLHSLGNWSCNEAHTNLFEKFKNGEPFERSDFWISRSKLVGLAQHG
jgi:hypothetical protein